MIKKVLRNLVCVVFVIFAVVSHAQTIAIDNNSFISGIYGNGSTISAPVSMAGCFSYKNVVQLYLCNPSNPAGVLIGSFNRNGSFTKFVNGRIPAGTTPRSDYYLVAKTTSPIAVSAAGPAFQIASTVGPSAFVSTTNTLNLLIDSVYYGFCSGNPSVPRSITIFNKSTAGSTTDINYKDEVSGVVSNLPVAVGGTKEITLDVTYYTLTCKAVQNGVMSVWTLYLVNPNYNLSLQTSGEQKACLPDDLQFSVNVTGNNGIASNFPGSLYLFTWGDGSSTDTLTHCQLLAANGVVSHTYGSISCGHQATVGGTTYQNAFPVDIKYINPFKVNATNPNNCDEPPLASFARIFRKPQANFTFQNPACITRPVTFTNITIAGTAQSGNTCVSTEGYEWFIDGAFVSNSRDLTTAFAATGNHTVLLRVTNASCSPSEKIQTICIEPAPLADFKMNGTDSIVSCAPVTFLTSNLSNANPCRNNIWKWQVYDSVGALVPPASGVYTIDSNDTAFQPSFTFYKPGNYKLRLAATNSCGTVTVSKTVHILGTAAVGFPADKGYCGAGRTINFATDINHTPVYNSSQGGETYSWTITGGNYNFVNGTSANDKYPQISFTDLGTYTVTLLFTNTCGQRSASQKITFGEPNTVALNDHQLVFCYSVTGINVGGIVTGPVDSVKWASSGTGGFNPANNVTSVYTPSLADKTAGAFNLILRAYAKQPNGCPDNRDTLRIIIFPENKGKDSAITICNNSKAQYLPVSSINGSSFSWTSTITSGSASGNTIAGNGVINDLLINNSNTSDAIVTYTIIPTANTCAGPAFSFRVTIKPNVQLAASANPAVICSNANTNILLSSTAVPALFSWTSTVVSGTGTGNTSASNQSVTIIQDLLMNTTATDVTVQYNIVAKAGNQCPGDTQNVRITVLPGPTVASAGPDKQLCGQLADTLTGNAAVTGTGVWTQVNGPPAAIETPNANITRVAGLAGGNTYKFAWNITASASGCAGSSDTVTISVFTAVNNAINFPTRAICAGEMVTIPGGAATGGNLVSYLYQWQQSTDNINFINIPGAVNTGIAVTPAQTTYYRRMVFSNPCPSISDTAVITVSAGISGNLIAANQAVCNGTLPVAFTGSVPAGGNGPVNFSWEISTDNISWIPITSSDTKDYTPGLLTATTWYRRVVSTALCNGSFGSKSNVVSVTVNQDAKALFAPLKSIDCAPFRITDTTLHLTPYSDRNGDFRWYKNDTLIGTASTFPGTTILQDNDSIIIKLVAISKYGCKNDSVQKTFYTVSKPHPSFTLSIAAGCGPLPVMINNTTPNASLFSFVWDFGNGRSSTLAQPGTIIFPIAFSHQDTVYMVKLKVATNCDTSTFSLPVKVSAGPKVIFTPNATEGCSPLPVVFSQNSLGNGNNYLWNFGDGSPVSATSSGTVQHIYTTLVKDTFRVVLTATNTCGSDSLGYNIVVSPNTIHLNFAINGIERYGCIPHTVHYVVNSTGANIYTLDFGDGITASTTKSTDTLTHTYTAAGDYLAILSADNGCSKGIDTEHVTVQQAPVVKFTASPLVSCFNDTIRFTNQSDQGIIPLWRFGDGTTSGLWEPAKIYALPGRYHITLAGSKVYATGNTCTDTASTDVIINGASGSLRYAAGYHCITENLRLEAVSANAVSYHFYFGDGDSLVTTTAIAFHQYRQPGNYIPFVYLEAENCLHKVITGDTVKVDKIKAGLQLNATQYCGGTIIRFTDTSRAFFGIKNRLIDFGDGTSSALTVFEKTYTGSGNFTVRMIAAGTSGCTDTLFVPLQVTVHNRPFSAIQSDTVGCTGTPITLAAVVQQADSIVAYDWNFGNGAQASGKNVSFFYNQSGTYTIRLISRTGHGCSDTAYRTVRIRQSPVISVSGGATICKGQTAQLQASGAANYVWQPSGNLSCFNCSSTTASPGQTMVYTVTGINIQGCSASTSVVVKVIQPFVVSVTGIDTICIRDSTSLLAAGADYYEWSPVAGLSSTSIPNPKASPAFTTTYHVTGYDATGCFTNTATKQIIVGNYPTVHLSGGGKIAAGTPFTFVPVITNGPIINYNWMPAIPGCNNCARPVTPINNTITYTLEVENLYHCKASDTIHFEVFCQSGQVYIPNAFTPDGDGHNDIFMIRGQGILKIEYFRIFNRWGQLVFEKANINANAPDQGWDGTVNKNKALPDVYVYTAKVQCTAGDFFEYKGNVTLIR